jgi:phenylacetic acid degradation operon negative regulatory protein
MLQESLWITPHELGQMFEEFLEHENLKSYCLVWEAKTIFGENEKEMVRKVWKLENLHGKYLDLIDKFAEIFSSKRLEKQRKKEWQEEYFSLLAQDPGLPKDLLPEDWLFEKAKGLFKKLKTTE